MKISKFPTLVLIAILSYAGAVAAQEKPDVLSGTFATEKLREILLPLGDWHPFPKASEHEGWMKIPEIVRTADVRQAEKHLTGYWATPKASVFLDFVRNGNRSRYETISFWFSAAIETIRLEDGQLRSSWGDRLYRILLTAKKTPRQGEFSIRIE